IVIAGATANETDDLDFIALTNRHTLPLRPGHNRTIPLHRDAVLRQFKMIQHLRDIQRARNLARLTIQANFNSHNRWMLPRTSRSVIPETDRDLTNVQFPMLNSYQNRGRPARVRAVLIEAEAIRHWSLDILVIADDAVPAAERLKNV